MNSIQCQDEILQVMFWMRGEGIGKRPSAQQLDRFLRVDSALLHAALERLIANGLVAPVEGGYELTPSGVEQGGRRFAEELSSVLGRDDHLSCSDPECECQRPGGRACPSAELSR